MDTETDQRNCRLRGVPADGDEMEDRWTVRRTGCVPTRDTLDEHREAGMSWKMGDEEETRERVVPTEQEEDEFHPDMNHTPGDSP